MLFTAARLALLLLFGALARADVYTLDLGAGSFSVGVASPKNARAGNPLDVLLNDESKRSTPTIISFSPEEPADIGYSAQRSQRRFPDSALSNFNWNLGAEPPEGCVRQAGDLGWSCDLAGSSVTLTDALAFVGHKVGTMVEAGDLFVLAHPEASLQERALLADAVQAGLGQLGQPAAVAGTISAPFGAGASFVLARLKGAQDVPPEFGVIDIGAGSICMSQLRANVAESDPAQYELTLVGARCFEGVGGAEITRRLQRRLHAEASALAPSAARAALDQPRVQLRLHAAAERAKLVLSANDVAPVSIDSLAGDWDLRTKLFRADLEEIVLAMLTDAGVAESARGFYSDDAQPILLIGGTSRVPAVQQFFEQLLAGRNFPQNVNREESAATGAAFIGALRNGMRARTKVLATERVPEPGVSVRASATYPEFPPESRRLPSAVFPPGRECPHARDVSLVLPPLREQKAQGGALTPSIEIGTWALGDEPRLTGGVVSACDTHVPAVSELRAELKRWIKAHKGDLPAKTKPDALGLKLRFRAALADDCVPRAVDEAVVAASVDNETWHDVLTVPVSCRTFAVPEAAARAGAPIAAVDRAALQAREGGTAHVDASRHLLVPFDSREAAAKVAEAAQLQRAALELSEAAGALASYGQVIYAAAADMAAAAAADPAAPVAPGEAEALTRDYGSAVAASEILFEAAAMPALACGVLAAEDGADEADAVQCLREAARRTQDALAEFRRRVGSARLRLDEASARVEAVAALAAALDSFFEWVGALRGATDGVEVPCEALFPPAPRDLLEDMSLWQFASSDAADDPDALLGLAAALGSEREAEDAARAEHVERCEAVRGRFEAFRERLGRECDAVAETRSWLERALDELDAAEPWDEPPVLTKDIERERRGVARARERLDAESDELLEALGAVFAAAE